MKALRIVEDFLNVLNENKSMIANQIRAIMSVEKMSSEDVEATIDSMIPVFMTPQHEQYLTYKGFIAKDWYDQIKYKTNKIDFKNEDVARKICSLLTIFATKLKKEILDSNGLDEKYLNLSNDYFTLGSVPSKYNLSEFLAKMKLIKGEDEDRQAQPVVSDDVLKENGFTKMFQVGNYALLRADSPRAVHMAGRASCWCVGVTLSTAEGYFKGTLDETKDDSGFFLVVDITKKEKNRDYDPNYYYSSGTAPNQGAPVPFRNMPRFPMKICAVLDRFWEDPYRLVDPYDSSILGVLRGQGPRGHCANNKPQHKTQGGGYRCEDETGLPRMTMVNFPEELSWILARMNEANPVMFDWRRMKLGTDISSSSNGFWAYLHQPVAEYVMKKCPVSNEYSHIWADLVHNKKITSVEVASELFDKNLFNTEIGNTICKRMDCQYKGKKFIDHENEALLISNAVKNMETNENLEEKTIRVVTSKLKSSNWISKWVIEKNGIEILCKFIDLARKRKIISDVDIENGIEVLLQQGEKKEKGQFTGATNEQKAAVFTVLSDSTATITVKANLDKWIEVAIPSAYIAPIDSEVPTRLDWYPEVEERPINVIMIERLFSIINDLNLKNKVPPEKMMNVIQASISTSSITNKSVELAVQFINEGFLAKIDRHKMNDLVTRLRKGGRNEAANILSRRYVKVNPQILPSQARGPAPKPGSAPAPTPPGSAPMPTSTDTSSTSAVPQPPKPPSDGPEGDDDDYIGII